ncbi:MAG: hypothetical protein LBV03_08555 [Fusobacteriales bacterium]|jgi:hypothetical protein|nr:hypothetical protein [Fusobacteriales bacterium]
MTNLLLFSLSDFFEHENTKELILEEINKFSCYKSSDNDPDIEYFLKNKSFEKHNNSTAKTYLLLDESEYNNGNLRIVAFFALALKVLDVSTMSKSAKDKAFKEYDNRRNINYIPAYLIGQLAKNDSYKTSVCGEEIFNHAIYQIHEINKLIGCDIVMLDCTEDLRDRFYMKKIKNFTEVSVESEPTEKRKLVTLFTRLSYFIK